MTTTTAAGPPTMFVHFTNAVDAAAMVAAGRLGLSRTIVDAVYAVAVGGANVPGVQHPRDARIEVAILFTAEAPDSVYPEEVIWHRSTDLDMIDATLISVAEAIALLDDSLGITD